MSPSALNCCLLISMWLYCISLLLPSIVIFISVGHHLWCHCLVLTALSLSAYSLVSWCLQPCLWSIGFIWCHFLGILPSFGILPSSLIDSSMAPCPHQHYHGPFLVALCLTICTWHSSQEWILAELPGLISAINLKSSALALSAIFWWFFFFSWSLHNYLSRLSFYDKHPCCHGLIGWLVIICHLSLS